MDNNEEVLPAGFPTALTAWHRCWLFTSYFLLSDSVSSSVKGLPF